MSEKNRVLYIAGSGRSGTTLLERLLGQVEGLFAAGELRYIWERGLKDNELCGCGSAFNDCDFWKEVVKRAFGDSLRKPAVIDEVIGLQGEVDRLRYMPFLRFGMRRGRMKAFCEKYLLPLYSAIREVSGRNIIIDSSKKPSYLYILMQCGFLDLHVVHVVRDPRAVAYSWSRKKVRHEVVGRDDYMPVVSAVTSTVWWSSYNSLMLSLRKKLEQDRYTFVNYDEMALNPKRTIGAILDSIGASSDLPFFTGESSVRLEKNHTVAGNPMRFKNGVLNIKYDDEWKKGMRKADRLIAVLAAYPLMRRLRSEQNGKNLYT